MEGSVVLSDIYGKNYLEKLDTILVDCPDLQENKHISLFLLAHQSIIAKLGYDLQDQKTVKLYHKLRDTYGNAW